MPALALVGRMSGGAITIAGAGPAGLAAAIVLARSGRAVELREWHDRVGARFHDDFQGIENWSDATDVMGELAAAGIAADFDHRGFREGRIIDQTGRVHTVGSERPVFYLVRRGSGPGTLDTALLAQARAAGATVTFGTRVDRLEGPGILATGPRRADVIANGILFDTDHPDAAWLALGADVAPGGYAYLLIAGGRGTLATCMFRDFGRRETCLENARAMFQRAAGIVPENRRRFGGFGSWRLPPSYTAAGLPLAGERAGFQDALAGFGIRHAIRSGVLAAQSLIDGCDYDTACRRQLAPAVARSALNRRLYELAPDVALRMSAARLSRGDVRAGLRRLYAPGPLSRMALPLLSRLSRDPLAGLACEEAGCGCNWCKCAGRTKGAVAHA